MCIEVEKPQSPFSDSQKKTGQNYFTIKRNQGNGYPQRSFMSGHFP